MDPRLVPEADQLTNTELKSLATPAVFTLNLYNTRGSNSGQVGSDNWCTQSRGKVVAVNLQALFS